MNAPDPDMVTFSWEGADGTLTEAEFTLEEAAALKRGETVARYRGNRTRHYTLSDRIAATRARLEGLTTEREALMCEFPGIEDGEWK